MQVFKAALRVFTKHPIYIGIYIVYLSFMGLFIGISNVDTPKDDFATTRPDIAIIDRDNSELSAGVTEFLGADATIIEIEDSRQALQDATAQDRASYIAIIPAGFGNEFADAVDHGTTPPTIETIVSYQSVAGTMMNDRVDEYLSTVSMFLTSGSATTEAEAIAQAADSMAESSPVSLVQTGESAPISQQYLLYMKFSGYTSMLGIIVCTAVLMGAFSRTEVRKRNLSSPISSFSMNAQIAGACLVVMLVTWLWVNGLGLVVFGASLATVAPATIGLIVLASLAFCTVSGAIGFLFGQLTTNEMVMNAAGNITGLVLSFLGGLWVPLDFLGESIVGTIARFTPTYYYGNAIDAIASLRDFSSESLAPVLTNFGIMLLFAFAIFAIALAIGRIRIRSAEAGG
ncbi:MAG: ABC transporter permease, partial [Raoultibacter sp.]